MVNDGVPCFWQIFPGLLNDFRLPRRPLMVRAALLRRRCADQLRRAHSARRVRDGADAAATELMLRAALLRRSCDGVADGAAQTSSVALILRIASRRDALNEEPASFPRGLIQTSMVVAHSPRPPPWPHNLNFNEHFRRDAQNEEPASFPRGLIQISMVVGSWPTVLGHPPGPVKF